MPDKKEKIDRRPPTNCDNCIHYIYDEDYGEDVCEVELDETSLRRTAPVGSTGAHTTSTTTNIST